MSLNKRSPKDDIMADKDAIMAELFAAMQEEKRRRRRRFAIGAVVVIAAFGAVGNLIEDGAPAGAGGLSTAATCEDFTQSDFPSQLRFLTDEAARRGSDQRPTDLQGTVSYICANGLDRNLGEVMTVAVKGTAGGASAPAEQSTTDEAAYEAMALSVETEADPNEIVTRLFEIRDKALCTGDEGYLAAYASAGYISEQMKPEVEMIRSGYTDCSPAKIDINYVTPGPQYLVAEVRIYSPDPHVPSNSDWVLMGMTFSKEDGYWKVIASRDR